jgi:hypothetical protein
MSAIAQSGLTKDASHRGQTMAPWQRNATTSPSATSKERSRLEYRRPDRTFRTWRPGSIAASTVSEYAIVPTAVSSSSTSNGPRRSFDHHAIGVSRQHERCRHRSAPLLSVAPSARRARARRQFRSRPARRHPFGFACPRGLELPFRLASV